MTLLFSLVCAFLFSATAMAQTLVTELQNMGVKSVSATPVSSLDELQEGKWYVMENDLGGRSYVYDNHENGGLQRATNGSHITAGMTTTDCGKALFRITNRKTATIGTTNVVGFHMQWGTGYYTKWPTTHNTKMPTSETADESEENTSTGWVYAAPLTYNNSTWFQLMKNTNTQFSDGYAHIAAGRNIFIDNQGANANVVDWSTSSSSVVNNSTSRGNNYWQVYEVELSDLVTVTIEVKNETDGNEAPYKVENLQIPVGSTIRLSDYLRKYSFVSYDNITKTVSADDAVDGVITYTQTYTVDEAAERAFPFASSYEELIAGDKWQSMFTKNGRMHVYDEETMNGSTKSYPTIDRATFTGLTDQYFWGFVRANRFSPVKIYNKAAEDKTLYLINTSGSGPVLFPYENASVADWTTNDWVIEKGKVADGAQYFGVRAMRTSCYINNNGNKGFMTTYTDGPLKDDGSNIKFTPELETYTILKDRALNAPFDAVYSLNKAARDEIRNSSANTVEQYQALIADINNDKNTTGFVDWNENKYYFLRNYTPAGGKTYLLGTINGIDGAAIEITGEDELGNTTDTHMTCSDANTIWQIVTKQGATAGGGNSTGIGVSRTIARYIKHINSGKFFTHAVNRSTPSTTDTNYRKLSDTTEDEEYYFVNLGAGQLFLKNTQYNGTGAQAMAHSLNCSNYGVLGESGNAHYKNTRDTWYGIEAKTLKIKLNEGNDRKYYATAHFPFAITITADDMKAYTVTDINDNGQLVLEVATGEIPAGTGLILIGDKATSTVNIIAGSTELAEANPILKGVNMAETFGSNIAKTDVLVLGKDANGNVGFYKPGSAMTGLRSNSAYILVSDAPAGTEANGLKFNFGGIANGIDGVNADSNNGQVIYDLQGRRVNKLSKGLYIVNGKKVIR